MALTQMGQAKQKLNARKRLLSEHPMCCYCGAKATTTDHCPPRALFVGRHWPEGYEFPACSNCNNEGRMHEQVIACLFKVSLVDRVGDEDIKRQLVGIKNNRSDIIAEWAPTSRNEVRRSLRERFGNDGDTMRHAGYGILNIGDRTQECINYFGKKLTMALFYKHCGMVLDGRMLIDILDFYKIPSGVIDSFLSHAPQFGDFKRGRVELSDQFSYRFNADSRYGVLFAVVRFREQLGYRMMAVSSDGWRRLRNELPQRLQDTDEIDAWLNGAVD